MFPGSGDGASAQLQQLRHCARLLPVHGDGGGFFCALVCAVTDGANNTKSLTYSTSPYQNNNTAPPPLKAEADATYCRPPARHVRQAIRRDSRQVGDCVGG
jgi:hypothetical protein